MVEDVLGNDHVGMRNAGNGSAGFIGIDPEEIAAINGGLVGARGLGCLSIHAFPIRLRQTRSSYVKTCWLALFGDLWRSGPCDADLLKLALSVEQFLWIGRGGTERREFIRRKFRGTN